MSNNFQFPPRYSTPRYSANIDINEGVGLAGDMQALEKALSKKVGTSLGSSVFGSGDWAEQFKIRNTPGLENAWFKNDKPSIFGGIGDTVGGLLDKVGGLGGLGNILAGIGALQTASLQRDLLEEERAARRFSNRIARENFNNQVSTINTQLRDRQNTRIARSSNDGSVMSTADYMAANGLKNFNG